MFANNVSLFTQQLTAPDYTKLTNDINASINSSQNKVTKVITTSQNSVTGAITISQNSVADSIIASQNSVTGAITTSQNSVADSINASQNIITDYIGIKFQDYIAQMLAQITDKLDVLKISTENLITTAKNELEDFIKNGNFGCCCDDLSNNLIEDPCNNSSIHKLLISQAVIDILTYYTNYALGKFEDVASSLTEEKFNALSIELYKLKSDCPDTSDYEGIRNIIINTFEALTQMIRQNAEFIALQASFKTVSERASILDDMEKLEEFLSGLSKNSGMTFIPDVDVDVPLFGLNPEIETYINLYGFPEGGVFDVDKLAEILLKL